MSGSIYYIGCHETERVKIGYTRGNPLARLTQLQTGSPTRLALIAVESGDRDTERQLHEEFQAHHIHGEWFSLCEELTTRMMLLVWLENAQRDATGEQKPRWVKVGMEAFDEIEGW